MLWFGTEAGKRYSRGIKHLAVHIPSSLRSRSSHATFLNVRGACFHPVIVLLGIGLSDSVIWHKFLFICFSVLNELCLPYKCNCWVPQRPEWVSWQAPERHFFSIYPKREKSCSELSRGSLAQGDMERSSGKIAACPRLNRTCVAEYKWSWSFLFVASSQIVHRNNSRDALSNRSHVVGFGLKNNCKRHWANHFELWANWKKSSASQVQKELCCGFCVGFFWIP